MTRASLHALVPVLCILGGPLFDGPLFDAPSLGRTLLGRTLLGRTLLGWTAPGVAHADIAPPPGFTERCTPLRVQQEGETCQACGAWFREHDKCENTLGKQGFSRRCKTRGASVWTEIWCKAVPPSLDGGTEPTDGGAVPPLPPQPPTLPTPSPAATVEDDGGARAPLSPTADGGVAALPSGSGPTAGTTIYAESTNVIKSPKAPKQGKASASLGGGTLGLAVPLAALLLFTAGGCLATAWRSARRRARAAARRR